ncbi:putative membrane protein, partial [Plasmodium reichenowi]
NTYIDYVIIFHKLNQSEILKKEIHISITKYFFWKEWVLYIFFNLMTCAIINIYWKKKERKENIFHVSVISLININIIYQQFI